MQNWNPIGWWLLVGGFLFGVIVSWAGAGEKFWLVSYTTMLAGLTVLLSNLIRALWRFIRSRNMLPGCKSGCQWNHWLAKRLSLTCRTRAR
jgi:cytochrome b561